MSVLGSLVVKVLGDITDVTQKLTDVQGVMGRTGAAFTRSGTVIAGAMVGAIGAGVAAVGAGAVSAINSAAEMEQQLSTIAANMGTTKDAIAPLGDLIQELGMNPNLKVEAFEAAQAIDMLAKNGLTMDQILAGAAESTVLLANATGGEFGQSADIMTDAMAIFGIEAENAIQAVNGITSVTTNSKFSIDDYRLALAQGAGVAAEAGVEFNDFNTAIAGISPLFASGSDAGTSFKTMLQRLVPASGPAADAMMELGLLTEDGSNKFFDAEGNLRSMAEVSQILQDATANLSEEQKTAALSAIFGADALRAAAGMANLGAEGFENLQGTMAQTDAVASAAERMDNFKGTIEIIMGVIDGFKLQIGDALLPMVSSLADQFLVLADTYGPQVVETITGIVDAVGQFMANLADDASLDMFIESLGLFGVSQEAQDSLFNVVDGLGQMWENLQLILEPIRQFIEDNVQLSDVLVALAVVVAAVALPALVSLLGTILAIAAPVVAVIAVVALLRAAWENNWGGIQEKTAAAWDIIKGVFDTVSTWLQTNIPVALDFLKARWDEIWPRIQGALQAVWDVIYPNILQPIINMFEVLIPVALEVLRAIWVDVVWPALETAIRTFYEGVLNYLDWVTEFYESLPGKIENMRDRWREGWDAIKGKIEEVAGPIREFFNRVEGFASWLGSTVFNFKINLPSLPDWAIPGSPLPIHTAWANFGREMNAMTIRPRVDVGPAAALTPAAVFAGEQQQAAPAINITFSGPVYGIDEFDRRVERAADEIARRGELRGRR